MTIMMILRNLMIHLFATSEPLQIKKSSMKALQSDGQCKLDVVGDVQLTFTRDHHLLKFNGLVVKKLDEGNLGGTPFLEKMILEQGSRNILLQSVMTILLYS